MKQHRLSFELEMVVERAYECIKLTGRLAYDTQLAAEQKLATAVAAVKRRLVVVDVSGLRFLDSTGLALLVRFFKQIVSESRAMAIVVRDNAAIEKILLMAKLDRLLPIVGDEQQLLSLAPPSSFDHISQEALYSAWRQRSS
ncbi:stage II sporulation protein AA [Geobacillus sp. CAMR12739]|uniref:STAS domain-containing protein n=1 Tax=Geobacillus sp. PK12 TaxID=2508525 RepID=UPI00049F8508|nr:STAS domain-containing protein [Geobacillus sp. PK12]KDE47806.1 stage II sporulation protein AA [Geobacillus sp. CAMR12739]RXS85514.1 anti-sigma factor antagonist [Geobacillus sp. PK12]